MECRGLALVRQHVPFFESAPPFLLAARPLNKVRARESSLIFYLMLPLKGIVPNSSSISALESTFL
jgi:hypothetical protein